MKFKNKATALEIGIETLLLNCEFQTDPTYTSLNGLGLSQCEDQAS